MSMKNFLDKTDYSIKTKATNSTREFSPLLTPAMLKVVKKHLADLEKQADEDFLTRRRIDREWNF